MRANIREIFTSATTVGCIIVLGAAATAIAGTLLWIPYTRKRIADRSERHAAAVAEAAKFETLYWDEYDALLAATTTAAAATAATANPVTDQSPQGDSVTMVYLPDRTAFGYYTNRKNSISYPQLETVARKYLVDNAHRDAAKQAYADRRSKTATPATTATTATTATPDTDVVDLGSESKTVAATTATATAAAAAATAAAASTGGGIFAMFRRYNRKPASASASTDKADEAPLEYTRFVYLGSMHDYENKNNNKRTSESSSASESASDCDAAIVYAEYKRLKIN